MPVIRSTTTRRRALGLALAGLSAASLSFAQATAPPYVGVNAGAPISGTSILFTDAVAADIAASGCRFVRINFIGAASGWDTARLALYDQIIANAVNNDLQVLAVFSNETVWGFSQAQWNENYNTTGLNAYTTAYAQTAYLLINRYKDDVKLFELWNEPSCWAVDPVTNPLNPGCSYIWPRIFANLLVETYKECIDQGGASFFSANRIVTGQRRAVRPRHRRQRAGVGHRLRPRCLHPNRHLERLRDRPAQPERAYLSVGLLRLPFLSQPGVRGQHQ
jgi:hypothetical protein